MTKKIEDGGPAFSRPLNWTTEKKSGFTIHVGRGVGLKYEAAIKAYSPGWIVTIGQSEVVYDSADADEDAAKAAAQADYEQRIRSALVDVPVAIPTANCCVCGRIIDTREKWEGGDDFGDETEAGKWTCSVQCYDAYVGFVPDVPAVEPVGEAGEMPGSNGGFTMAVFKASDVPLGTKLYRHPPLSREGEDSAEGEVLSVARAIAKVEGFALPNDMSLPFSDGSRIGQVMAKARAALAATRSGSASEGGDHG